MEFTVDILFKAVQIYVCHSVALFYLTVPQYSLRKNISCWMCVAVVSIGVSLATFQVSRVSIMDRYTWAYLFTLVLYFMVYGFLSTDVLSRKVLLFSGYVNFYSFVWTVSRLLGVLCQKNEVLSESIIASIIYAIFILLLGKKINDSLCKVQYEGVKNWWLFAIISVLFTVILVQKTVVTNNISWFTMEELNSLIIFLISMFLTYLMMIKALQYMLQTEAQQAEMFHAKIYENQIQELKSIELENRRNRHDIRHHNRVIADFIHQGNMTGALEYLNDYENDARESERIRYCEHETANAVLSIFAKKAKIEQIRFISQVVLKEESTFKATDITVLFSNILENAYHACVRSQEPDCEIQISSHYKKDKLVIVCSNTCREKVKFQENGLPLNPNRMGIGTQSIQAITKKYDGHVDFYKKEEIFTCQLFLKDTFL